MATEFITLDGVFEDPGGQHGGRGGWAFQYDRGEAGNQFKSEELMAADAQLLGRVTYEGFAAAWPNMKDDEFGARMNSMPKYVVSSTLQSAGWENSTIISGALESEIPAIAERHAGDILIAGSGQLVRGLLAADLLDEIRLMVYPVLLGGGARLFGETDAPKGLSLQDVRAAGDTAILVFGR
ncbi:MAG TPA: dihydrofolate reductase family protein [Solirubrobacteraceae bacterium]|nr:dihydrofolate reductase family protein [Solirubrobacteraceae bacterium]